MPRALITGINGQDGSYLAELLLENGYEVHGTVRPAHVASRSRLDALRGNPSLHGQRLFLHEAELNDSIALGEALKKSEPDEVYHLASPSDVAESFREPEATSERIALGTVRLLDAIRATAKQPRFFYASSSQIFGEPKVLPQDEETPFHPINPYGCAKAFATQIVTVYRRAFGLFACNGIMFNHESPRRGENFVTKKICRAAARVKLGLQNELLLGDVSAQRDWGHARDYARGMWRILQHEQPDDFVLATGRLHSVQNVVELAFQSAGLDWREYVKQDPRLMRPAEPGRLVGNPAKAKRLLGWEAEIAFEELIAEMTQAELEALRQGAERR